MTQLLVFALLLLAYVLSIVRLRRLLGIASEDLSMPSVPVWQASMRMLFDSSADPRVERERRAALVIFALLAMWLVAGSALGPPVDLLIRQAAQDSPIPATAVIADVAIIVYWTAKLARALAGPERRRREIVASLLGVAGGFGVLVFLQLLL